MKNSVKDIVKEPRKEWSSEEQLWVDQADRFDAMLEPANGELLEALALESGEAVLDVGCGTGHLSRHIAQLVGEDGTTYGVDVSEGMLAGAAAGASGVTWVNQDAQVMALEREFDAIVSRFGVMMFDDPTAAFSNLRRHLRPGGRIALAVWRDVSHNEWTQLPLDVAARHLGPLPSSGGGVAFSLADKRSTMAVLETAGFIDVEIEPFDFRAWIGTDAYDVIDFFTSTEMGSMLDMLPHDVRVPLLDDLSSELASRTTERGVELAASAWLVTARRRRCSQ